MADESKRYIINVESNLDEYAKQADEARKRVDELTVENLKLKNSGTATKEEIEKSNSALRVAEHEYRNAKKSVDLATKANNAQAGSYEKLYRQWQLAQTQLKLLEGTITKNADGTYKLSDAYIQQSKRVADAKKALDSFGRGVNDNRLNVGNYTESIKQAIGEMQMLPGVTGQAAMGITRITKAAKMFIATPIGAVIAALAAAIGALTSYFKRSEEGQEALLKVSKIFSSVLDNILDVVDKVGKAIYTAFTAPKEAIKALGDFIKSQITNRIEALKDMGKAIGMIFRGEFKEGFKELGKNAVDLVTGVENTVDKVVNRVKNFVKEVKQDAIDAARLADELNRIDREERQYLVENSRLAKESAKLRAEAEKEKFLDAERSIELTKQAFDLDEKILAQELDIAKRKAANAAESARLANSTKETLDEIAQLEADVESKQAAFEEKRRERLRTLNKLRKEAFNQEKERITALLEIETSRADAITAENDKIAENELYTYEERLRALQDNLKIRTDLLQKQAELELLELEKDFELETISRENFEIKKLAIQEKYRGEASKIASEIADDQKTLLDEQLEWENERRAINEQNRLAIREANNQYEFELQREKLDAEYQAEIFAAEKIGADVALIKQKYAALNLQIDRAERDAKLALYADFAGSIAQLFGEETAIGKAAAVATATINTYKAASEALAAYPPPFNYIAMATAIATGIANVRKILAVKSGLPGETGVAASVPTALSSSLPTRRIFAPTAAYNTPALSQAQINALPNTQNVLTAEDIAAAVAKMPSPVVTVEDINARTSEYNKVKVRGTI